VFYPNCGNHRFPLESLTGVIFGLKTSAVDQDKVRQWVATGPRQPIFYRAEPIQDQFSIRIKGLGK
jgi:hypothetical protein